MKLKFEKKLKILVSGTGKMGMPLLRGLLDDERYDLLPWAISDDPALSIDIGSNKCSVIHLDQRMEMIPNVWNDRGPFFLVDAVPEDFSQGNAEFYSQFESLPVIMMSTGIKDLSKIRNTLLLPNACLHIMAVEKFIAGSEEGFFADERYSLAIEESHQKKKLRVSGTACKMVPNFNRLGLKFEEKQIVSFRSEEDYSRIGIPMDFYGAHGYHKYTVSSNIEQDMRLRLFFSRAEDFFTDNTLFKSLFFLENNPGSKTTTKALLWGSDLVDPLKYRTFSFGISLVEFEGKTEVSIFHTILGHEPYVKGVLNNALPFMQEKCMNGLTGENFTSLQLYDWAMK